MKVDLIVRGISVLRPGVEGISENIRVISLVGRFLEHVRLYYFKHAGANNSEAMYAGSADLMRRNLDYRVEVLFPIEDPRILAWLRDGILELQLRDNVRARLLRFAFSVGAADDTITAEESAELNEIGKELGFSAAEVDAVRVEFKDHLSAIQSMRAARGA